MFRSIKCYVVDADQPFQEMVGPGAVVHWGIDHGCQP